MGWFRKARKIAPDKAKELDEELQRIRRLHEESAIMVEEANSLLGEVKDWAENFHNNWQSHEVEVKYGPFKGWRGVVDGTYRPKVLVAFPTPDLKVERLWLHTAAVQMLARRKNGE